MSGLFNKDFVTEDAGLLPSPADPAPLVGDLLADMTSAESLSSTTPALDLLSSLDKYASGSLFGVADELPVPSSSMSGVDGNRVVPMATNSDFFEVFTDLSDLLGDTELPMDVETLLDFPSTSEAPQPAEGRKAEKRKANEAFPFDDILPSVNPDHSDYTKGKRARKKSRVASVAESVGSEADDILGVTSTSTEVVEGKNAGENKYKERRVKNNIASKRSRESRKQKFVVMEDQCVELERSNGELRLKIEDLERLTKQMKDILIQRLAGTK